MAFQRNAVKRGEGIGQSAASIVDRRGLRKKEMATKRHKKRKMKTGIGLTAKNEKITKGRKVFARAVAQPLEMLADLRLASLESDE